MSHGIPTTTGRSAGAVLGIIMLDTQFPRLVGDAGHPETWPVNVHQEKIRGVWPVRVVTSAANMRQAKTVPAFINIARILEGRGVQAITTSCGFLVLIQKELQASVHIPIVTSSLLQLPELLQKEEQIGVLTISSSSLGKEHLRAAGVPKERIKDVLIQGMKTDTEFVQKILGNQPQMDWEKAKSEVIQAAVTLKTRAPNLKTLLLECTNMPPCTAQIQEMTGLKVLSLIDDPRLQKVMKATQEGIGKTS